MIRLQDPNVIENSPRTLSIPHARSHVFQRKFCDYGVTWRFIASFRSKDSLIGRNPLLPVAYAHTTPFQGNLFGVTWRLMTSLPVKRHQIGQILRYFRLHMRAPHPSEGTSKESRDVWWRHFRWRGPTRANIAQFTVAHAQTPPFQENPFGITWRLMTSHPVDMLLPVMRNGTSKVWKKHGNGLRMHTWSLLVTWLPVPDTWLPVTSFLVRAVPGDVTPGSSSSNATLAVPIYY